MAKTKGMKAHISAAGEMGSSQPGSETLLLLAVLRLATELVMVLWLSPLATW